MYRFCVLFSFLCINFLSIGINKSQNKNSRVVYKLNSSSTFVEIDVDNYVYNLKQLRNMVGDSVKICVVLKADAFGHGIKNLLDATLNEHVDYISVTENREFELICDKVKFYNRRHRNKKVRLLRLAPVLREEFIEAQNLNWNIEEIIGCLDEATMISKEASLLSKKLKRKIEVSVHLNIETGMGRMGFRNCDEIKQVIDLPHLKLVGIMTHFASNAENNPNDIESTNRQMIIFDSIVGVLNLDKNIIRHVANSPSVIKTPWNNEKMVRVAALLFGENSKVVPINLFKPVMTYFKTAVCAISHNVPPKTPISYGAKQYTRDDTFSSIATLRVGYVNGYPQNAYENGMNVLIRGRRFPVIGITTMNMLMVDITDQSVDNPVKINDEVVLIGKQGTEEITWTEFSERNKIGISLLTLSIGNQTFRRVFKKK